MKVLMRVGEWICGVLIDLLTIPMLVIGFFAGLGGTFRYLRMKFM